MKAIEKWVNDVCSPRCESRWLCFLSRLIIGLMVLFIPAGIFMLAVLITILIERM
jgi:hypothetical protein